MLNIEVAEEGRCCWPCPNLEEEAPVDAGISMEQEGGLGSPEGKFCSF